MFRIGVISDTHGHPLPAEVMRLFDGVDLIVHAGDVGSLDVLTEVGAIAPVVAVRGNTDQGETAFLPDSRRVDAGGVSLSVTHSPPGGDNLAAMSDAVVIAGHTHQACVVRLGAVLYVNPGSPVAPRGESPSVAMVDIGPDGTVRARIHRL